MANMPGMNLTELNARDMRKIYMITYSQVNLGKCPENFSWIFSESIWLWKIYSEANVLGSV